MFDEVHQGGCLCGAVRYEVRGAPFKSGLCHCRDCKKITGSAYLSYADWRPDRFTTSGRVESYAGRSFCPRCGSRVFSLSDDQVEIFLGTLDETPTSIAPQVEGWVIRREHWLAPVGGLPQYDRDIG